MYQRILVPLDGSKVAEQVLPYVRLLAEELKAEVELFRAIEPLPPAGLTDPAREVYRQETLARLEQEARDYLEPVAAALKEDGLTVSTTVQKGTPLSSPASSIASRGGADANTLIAMCSHGRSGINRWVLGSVTDEVIHTAACPLLVIRAREEADLNAPVKLDTVIVPLDESPQAEQALPHAVSLAQALGLKIVLLRVTPPEEDYSPYLDYAPSLFQEVSREIDGRAVAYLHNVRDKLFEEGAPTVEERLLPGHPSETIVDLARETPNNLIAMTTHGRSGIGRWILGSVADRVVRNSGDPVLLIRAKE